MYSIYRTLKNKYVPYYSEGLGRDRYIIYNNGGFLNKDYSTINASESLGTHTNLDTKIIIKSKSLSNKAPNFHYQSDGKGRDRYIMINGGGLYYESKPLNSFKLSDFLRGDSIDNNNECRNSFSFLRGRNFLSKSEYKYNQLLKSKEKDIINRLYEKEKKKFSRPKKIEITENNYTNNNSHTNSKNKLPEINCTFDLKRKENDHLVTMSQNISSIKDNYNTINSEACPEIINLKEKTKNKIKGKGRNHFLSQAASKNDLDENILNNMDKINKYNSIMVQKREKRINYQPPYLRLNNYYHP